MSGQPTPGPEFDAVQTHTDGYVFKVDDRDRLSRFLCLGAAGGTYHVIEQQLKRENVQCITRMIAAGRGMEVVETVVDFSKSGRTAKQNGLMFAMAMCAKQSVDPETKAFCYANLHVVCRIPTHLFAFIAYCEKLSENDEPRSTGWGRAHRNAITKWYKRFGETPEETKRLAMLVTKYRNRMGWSHLDVLRLTHPNPDKNSGLAGIFRYIVKGLYEATKLLKQNDEKLMAYLEAVEDVKGQKNPTTVSTTGLVELIKEHRLEREHVNTDLLQFPDIWEALLEHMPMTAMIRNLGKMSAIGMLTAGSQHEQTIVRKLRNTEALKKASIHPFNMLVTLYTYKNGRGDLGYLTWDPNSAVMEALDDAFYQTFKYVEPTNKRYLLALDVSGSMFWGSVNGNSSIQPGTAAAALSLVTAETEMHCEFVSFSDQMEQLDIHKGMILSQVEQILKLVPMGGTDCSQPMVYAMQNNKLYDVFVVYTDSETGGHRAPSETLRDYRRHSGIHDAKLIVVAMTSNGFSIADPDDPNMLDMAGFDSSGPQIMLDFIGGFVTTGRSVHDSTGVNAEMEVDIGTSEQETNELGGLDEPGADVDQEGASLVKLPNEEGQMT